MVLLSVEPRRFLGRARRAPLALALIVACASGSGCGSAVAEKDGRALQDPGQVEQPFPPRAAEPRAAGTLQREPAGRVVRVGGPAEGVVVDPASGRLAVALQKRAQLVLLDAASGAPIVRVRLPAAPRHLELTRPGGRVLVPAEESDTLVAVDVRTGDSTATRVGDHPHDVAFVRGRSYTADEFGSTLTEVVRGRRLRQVPVDAQPGSVLGVGDQVGIVSVRAYTFELFGTATLRGGGSQSAGVGPTHAVADADGRVYITDTRGDALTVFATRPRLKWLSRVALRGSPYGIALDERRGRLWVTLSARNELVQLSLGERPRRQRTLATIRQPNSVAVDPRTGRVIVPSAADDAVQLIDP